MEKEFKIDIVQALCIIESGWTSKDKNRQDLYWHAKKIVSEEAEKNCLKYELFTLDEKLSKLSTNKIIPEPPKPPEDRILKEGGLPKPPKSIKK